MSEFHGRFIWYELMTPDVAGAETFYSDVVGWTCDHMPMGEMTYTIVGPGVGVGGMMPLTDEAKAQGIPPNWTAYVYVDDVDAAAAKVKQLGGAVNVEPTDIPGIGRFAIVADPTGAVIAIMTPAPMETPRPEVARDALGNVGWHELYAGDLEKAFAFYAEMFGWKKDSDMDMGPMGAYRLYSNQDGQMGGMMKKPDQIPVPCWVYYFSVADIDQAAAKITASGGQVMMGPHMVPSGDWIVQAVDPQGAVFALTGKKAA
jgi:predicted enzyme related to lactoylglutathione lyase